MNACVRVSVCVPARPLGGLWQVCRVELPLPLLTPPVRGNVPLDVLQGPIWEGGQRQGQQHSCGRQVLAGGGAGFMPPLGTSSEICCAGKRQGDWNTVGV